MKLVVALFTFGVGVHFRSETEGANGNVGWDPKQEVACVGVGRFLGLFTEHIAHPRGGEREGDKTTIERLTYSKGWQQILRSASVCSSGRCPLTHMRKVRIPLYFCRLFTVVYRSRMFIHAIQDTKQLDATSSGVTETTVFSSNFHSNPHGCRGYLQLCL